MSTRTLVVFLVLGVSACCPSPASAPSAARASARSTPAAASDEPSEQPSAPVAPSAVAAGGFDAALAARLGADEYGMRRYVMALLKAGPRRDQDEATAAKLQREHLANIERLANEGKLVLAGPFLDDGELRGIYVFAVSTVEEAQALTATDPAIQAGRLVMDLHPWYGSAALGEVNAIHTRVARKTP